MIRDVADSTDISPTSVHKTPRQNLEMKKASLKLVLKVWMTEQKKERVFIAKTFLNNCDADPTLLGQIITGDELRVFKYNPSTKHQSMWWKRGDEPQHKKGRMAVPAEIDVNFIFRCLRCGNGGMGAVLEK